MKISTLTEEMKFLVIGGIGLLLGVVVFCYYNKYLGIEENSSFAIAFVVAEVFSFITKKFWVFQNKVIKETKIQIFWTLVLVIAYLQIKDLVIYELVNNRNVSEDSAKILLIAAFLIPNFYIARYIFISQKAQ